MTAPPSPCPLSLPLLLLLAVVVVVLTVTSTCVHSKEGHKFHGCAGTPHCARLRDRHWVWPAVAQGWRVVLSPVGEGGGENASPDGEEPTVPVQGPALQDADRELVLFVRHSLTLEVVQCRLWVLEDGVVRVKLVDPLQERYDAAEHALLPGRTLRKQRQPLVLTQQADKGILQVQPASPASGLTIRIQVEDFKVAVLDGPEQLFLVEEVLFESSQRRARLQREHEFRQQCQEEVAAAGLTAAEEEDIRAQIDVLVQSSSSSSSSSADTASAAGDAEAPEVPQEHKGDNATSVNVEAEFQSRREALLAKKTAQLLEERFPFMIRAQSTPTEQRDRTAVGARVSFLGTEHVYGLPERTVSFNLPSSVEKGGRTKLMNEPYRLFNADVFEFEINDQMGLYGSIPLVVGHRVGRTTGFLFMNPSDTFVDIERVEMDPTDDETWPRVLQNDQEQTAKDAELAAEFVRQSSVEEKGFVDEALEEEVDSPLDSEKRTSTQLSWISEAGELDMFVLTGGASPRQMYHQYARISGLPPLPPLFSLGYHQCRWNYKDDADVRMVHSKFDEHDIPVDVIWLDIEHTDSKKYLTWDERLFPDSKALIQSLAASGRKMVNTRDPHIKRDTNYPIFAEALEKGYFVKNSNGDREYEGMCWPGSSSWLDFFNPEVREWYASLYHPSRYEGSTEDLFPWIDMNEPSVFHGPETSMDKNAIHHGGLRHREVHNMYGLMNAISAYQGDLGKTEGVKRPFVLSRSFFVGSHRYVAVWTGDNRADWKHLESTQPMLLSLSVAGMPFVGADVGGFFKNPETDLLVRWYQVGAFQPFFRAHAELQTARREPWLFGEHVLKLIRQAIVNRYKFLPYIYTTFFEASTQGVPVMRPLWMEFSDDKALFAEEQSYMLGEALLIRPVTSKDTTSVTLTLPGTQPWYNAFDGTPIETSSVWSMLPDAWKSHEVTLSTPEDRIVVLQRGGTIIPRRERVRRSSQFMRQDPFTLFVALDSTMEAHGLLYLDDGETFAYQQGVRMLRRFTVTPRHQDGRVRDLELSGHTAPILSVLGGEEELPASASFPLTQSPQLERVVVAGLPAGTTIHSVTLVVTPSSTSSTTLHVAPILSLEVPFTHDASQRRLTIKLAGHDTLSIPISQQFSLLIKLA